MAGRGSERPQKRNARLRYPASNSGFFAQLNRRADSQGTKERTHAVHKNRDHIAALRIADGNPRRVRRKGSVANESRRGREIRRVEDGVDEFQKYLERRGDSARSTAASPQAQANKGKRRTTTSSQPSTANANAKKDELEDAMGDLNRSTNRLRRKFDPTDNWQGTRVQVESVLDDGRRINQAVARGSYGSEVARLGLRSKKINDLARAYGLTPLGA